MNRCLAVMLGLGMWVGLARAAGTANGDAGLIARIHFAGMTQIIADPNAAKLREIRALPESKALWEDLAKKLATAPFRQMNLNSPPRKDDHAAQLRPLVEDVLMSESYCEMRTTTGGWPEFVLAVKLDNSRATAWQGTLAKVLTDWTGIAVKEVETEGLKGWELKKHHSPNLFRFFRAGDWVVFGWGEDELGLQPAILKGIKETKRPVAADKKNWLDAWLDWPKLMAGKPGPFPFKLPPMQLSVEGRKDYLRPELKLQFPQPLGMKIDAWQIPTNIIFGPVSSITFARGFGSWLSSVPEINNLNAQPMPNQAIMWALPNIPFETCVVTPVKNGRQYLDKISPGLISLINAKMVEVHGIAKAQLTTNRDIAIHGIPVLAPFLRATNDATGEYLLAGIFGPPADLKPFPWNSLLGNVQPADVVYYDWELNGERTKQWRPILQLFAATMSKVMPTMDSPAQKWLQAIEVKLGTCATVGTVTGPNQLTFVRNGTVGLSGLELVRAAMWLDTPGFPLEFKLEQSPEFTEQRTNPRPK